MTKNKITNDVCVKAYEEFKNLKVAADSIGMKWQTLYARLRSLGIPVTGDKQRYGSLTDKVGFKGEQYFKKIVPFATDENSEKFQAPIDFSINGIGIDVKSSIANKSSTKFKSMRWSFSIKRQQNKCDFFVFFAYFEDSEIPENIFLIPSEIVGGAQTISISCSGNSKWFDYLIDEKDLFEFFSEFNTN